MNHRKGSAVIEAVLMLPLLLLLFLNTVNAGVYLFAWVTLNNAARAAVEYQIYNGVAIGFPQIPTFSSVCRNVWYPDVSSIPSPGTPAPGVCAWPNVSLEICSNKNGNISCQWSGSGAPPTLTIPTDPEPALHTLYVADVAYLYTPLIPVFTLPIINVPLTFGPTTLHRQVVMRSMQ